MMNLLLRVVLLAGALFLVGCGGGSGIFSSGSSASPPLNVKVTPGDSGAIVTWTMEPGVEYWVFSAATTNLTPQNWAQQPQARVIRHATSPTIIAPLANGSTFSITINGRKDGGPGGDGSPSISVVPRLAGLNWTPGTPLAAAELRGISFAALIFPGIYVAVGSAGSAFISSDAITYTAVTTNVTTQLNGSAYGGGRHVAVGVGGVAVNSLDAMTWTKQTTPTTNDLNGVALSGNGLVAVGNGGVILRSGDGGVTWSTATSGTTQSMYGISALGTSYIAVGANGTILTSNDGDSWTTQVSGTTKTLRSVVRSLALPLVVAVGDDGTILTSPDAVTWTPATSGVSVHLNSVTLGGQFTAVGDLGTIIVSTDGKSWTTVASGTTSRLNAVVFGLLGYGAVGVGGVNLSSY